jgi:hypothetical protein
MVDELEGLAQLVFTNEYVNEVNRPDVLDHYERFRRCDKLPAYMADSETVVVVVVLIVAAVLFLLFYNK